MGSRHIGALTESKAANWKPLTGKTAQEMLDDHAAGLRKFTEIQLAKFREILAKDPKGTRKAKAAPKARKPSKPRAKKEVSPIEMRKGETPDEYVARITAYYQAKLEK